MTPNNLLIRLNDNAYNVGELQEILLSEIRQEFNHNLSQQIYMSDEAWQQIKDAVENLLALINDAASELQKDEPALQLVKKIFAKIIDNQDDITGHALRFIKNEVRTYF
jgi:Na+/phosphate symporter